MVEKLKNIQALRAIAALLVLVSHIQFPMTLIRDRVPSYTAPGWLRNSAAAIGVDIFFVISGYVICLTASRHQQGAWHFFRNRFARVAPFHYFISLAILAIVVLRSGVSGDRHFLSALWNTFFFLPLFATGHFEMPVNSFAWSLCFEIWFYTLFSLLLLRASPRRAALLLPAILFVGAVLLRWYAVRWFFPRFAFDPLCLEFGLGCLIFFGQDLLGPRGTLVCLGGAAVLFVLVVPRYAYLCGVPFHSEAEIWNGSDYDHSWKRVAVWGLPSAALFTALLGLERHFRFVLPRPLIFLGDASYSLYLIQPMTVILTDQFTRASRTANPLVPAMMLIVLTVGLAALSWRYVERPLTHLARRWLGIAPQESRAGEPTFPPAQPGRGAK
jgi:exopolysaccharide production protein ExoZ